MWFFWIDLRQAQAEGYIEKDFVDFLLVACQASDVFQVPGDSLQWRVVWHKGSVI